MKTDGNEKDNSASSGKNQEFFDTSHLTKDLKGRSVRGGMVTVGAQGVRFALQLGSTAVLARLLTPADYGLVAMVAVVMNFAMMFKDMGLSMATVQKAEINHGQISNLFWFNVVVSFCLFIVVIALSPVVAWFYGEPRLTAITMALACSFILGGLTVQHQALLRRQMQFGKLALVEVGAMLGGITVAVASALLGAEYWALVYMQIANALVMAITVWFACNWRPTRPKRGTGVKPMLAFGGHLTGFGFVNYFARNLDKLLIGKVWGGVQLGLYSKAYGLLTLPLSQINAPISAVAIPTLSRLQGDAEKYRKYYLKAISLIAFISMPLVMYMFVMSEEIIHLVLGEQWTGAARIFRVLGIGAFVQPISVTAGWVFVSTGHADRMFRWAIIAVPIIILSFMVGLPFGAYGVALSYSIANVILVVPQLFYAFRTTVITVMQVIRSILVPLTASLTAALAITLMKNHVNLSVGLGGLLLAFVTMAFLYSSIACCMCRSLAPFREFAFLYQSIRKSG